MQGSLRRLQGQLLWARELQGAAARLRLSCIHRHQTQGEDEQMLPQDTQESWRRGRHGV